MITSGQPPAASPVDDDSELAFLATTAPTEEDSDANLLRHQLVTSPLLTYSAVEHHAAHFPSRGLLGTSAGKRVYFNTNAPSSVVICGVQGSGKSHTVSCLLECALIADPRVGKLPEPLSALVFHFDMQDTGRPCEAAFLSSPAAHLNNVNLPQVTVLCSPSNVNRRRRAYASLAHVRVEPLCLSERDISADRMLAIMGCDNLDTMPLYMHTALLIIRNMGVEAFSYPEFKRRIGLERLDGKQKAMIELRMHLLEAFLQPGARDIESYFTAGGLVLVDLTDPFLDGLTAAVLFDIVLGWFTQWQTAYGKLVVLDEAHKYLVNSDSARLTQSVGNLIRLQRHLATRVIIATQEPTVIPPTILDLASTIICHRFSSPAWCAHLARHVSAGSESAGWYRQVMALPTGSALVFSPAAVRAADEHGGVALLGKEHLMLRVRPRLTMDGGASLLAVGRSLPTL
ncbi:p-loop containing nucleoside triphosphate hydrolase protein [Mycena venus]|uniref:p-loop containing nucleoside triphosphate hydrolase protein n=1 Tax=Mycena venus TaxID=2733690 RepID=A0A8H6XQL2_9AGAR|nr:p-loop containing nucleoside triphosphate hydrolase protein [Mycena venus]